MDQYLPLIRAAKLAGVTRSELQTRIKHGELPSFDGSVKVEDLLKLYPDTRLHDNRALERLEHIKAAAYGKDVLERSLPDPEVLAQRIAVLGNELARARLRADHYGAALEALETRLRDLEHSGPESARGTVHDMKLWLQRTLHQPLPDQPEIAHGSWLRVLAPQVRLVPDNDEFLVEGADTVLEAALRAGLSIDYGCSNGNCGKCKARIVSGEVREVRPHDFVIGESERRDGQALLCSVAPVTDLVIETGVAHRPDQIPLQNISAGVRDLIRLGSHILLLRVQTPRTKRLRFLGGQHVRVGVDGGRLSKHLPLANCPCDDRNLVFHLAEDRDDPFTAWCFEHLHSGDTIEIEGPFGDFVMRETVDRPLVFLACDTGFAPIRSLIEHVIALDQAEAMDLIWVASGGGGHYQDNLCRAWDDALDNFRYQALRLSVSSDAEGWKAALGGALRTLEAPADRDYYIAGPTRFVDTATQTLQALGVPTERLVVQSLPIG